MDLSWTSSHRHEWELKGQQEGLRRSLQLCRRNHSCVWLSERQRQPWILETIKKQTTKEKEKEKAAKVAFLFLSLLSPLSFSFSPFHSPASRTEGGKREVQTISLKKRGGVKGEMKATTGREGRKGGNPNQGLFVVCCCSLNLTKKKKKKKKEGRKERNEGMKEKEINNLNFVFFFSIFFLFHFSFSFPFFYAFVF